MFKHDRLVSFKIYVNFESCKITNNIFPDSAKREICVNFAKLQIMSSKIVRYLKRGCILFYFLIQWVNYNFIKKEKEERRDKHV